MIYIIAIGAFQSLLLYLLMYNNKHRKPFDFLVKLLLLFVFVHLAIKFFIYTVPSGLYQKGFVTFIDLAYGPLLWVISLKLKNDQYHPAKHWFLFLPALIAAVFFILIVLVSLVYGQPPIALMEIYNTSATGFVLPILFVFSFLAYRNTRSISNFWATEQVLIRNISIVFLVISTFFITMFLSRLIFKKELLNESMGRMIFYSNLVFICIMILRYLMISQMEKSGLGGEFELTLNVESDFLTNKIENQIDDLMPEICNEPMIKKLEQTHHHQKIIVEKLDKLMMEKKFFLDPELNLVTLADQTQISRHNISEALNQYLGKTYYAYINEYRIKEVLYLFDKCKRQGIKPNILSIAFEMGFNSKSTFHLYFKKITGSTPSEYFQPQVKQQENDKFSTENNAFLHLGMN